MTVLLLLSCDNIYRFSRGWRSVIKLQKGSEMLEDFELKKLSGMCNSSWSFLLFLQITFEGKVFDYAYAQGKTFSAKLRYTLNNDILACIELRDKRTSAYLFMP